MAKVKFYAVREGRIPGIYTTWDECKSQTDKFPNAKYKSFGTLDEADSYMLGIQLSAEEEALFNVLRTSNPAIKLPSISVDAACSGNPGKVEYRCVDNSTGEVLFHIGPYELGTNNIGEYLALVHGLTFLENSGKYDYVYTDSRTGLAWLKKGKHNSTLVLSPTSMVQRLLDRADTIAKDMYDWGRDKLIKWDTKNWGEIPADFGRK